MSAPVPALVVMGVSGCGKSELGTGVAGRYGAAFIEADEFHPAENVDKMRRGVPLDDADRAGWLGLLADKLRDASTRGQPAVMACSALKARYRDQLRAAAPGRSSSLSQALNTCGRARASGAGFSSPTRRWR